MKFSQITIFKRLLPRRNKAKITVGHTSTYNTWYANKHAYDFELCFVIQIERKMKLKYKVFQSVGKDLKTHLKMARIS